MSQRQETFFIEILMWYYQSCTALCDGPQRN